MKKLFAIDPGTNSCGWSFYEKDAEYKLIDSGTIEGHGSNAMERSEMISKELFYEISMKQADLVICEKPLKRGPGGRSGHIHVLVHFCGMIHGLLANHSIKFKYIEVMKWKGALTKEIHHPRIIRDIKEKYSGDLTGRSEDEIDAAGLGYWFIKNSS